MKGTFINC